MIEGATKSEVDNRDCEPDFEDLFGPLEQRVGVDFPEPDGSQITIHTYFITLKLSPFSALGGGVELIDTLSGDRFFLRVQCELRYINSSLINNKSIFINEGQQIFDARSTIPCCMHKIYTDQPVSHDFQRRLPTVAPKQAVPNNPCCHLAYVQAFVLDDDMKRASSPQLAAFLRRPPCRKSKALSGQVL